MKLDAVVVGAGFAGMYMLHRLRGLGLSVRVLETGDGVGGTWYWNRYPGARCDIESMEYSYQFSEELQQEWKWSERYSPQPEILRYANHVADRFDLRPDIQFNTRVVSAHFDDTKGRWTVKTEHEPPTKSGGDHGSDPPTKSGGDVFDAQFCIMATGCLSSPNTPHFEGMDDFAGPTYHTGQWPHEGVDFSGQRVAVIGTGSSGIQSIPIIAEQAEHLFVFQRTPNYTVPAHNAPLDPEYERKVKADYRGFRERNSLMPAGFDSHPNEGSLLEATPEEREKELESRWQEGGLGFLAAYNDLGLVKEANDIAAEFIRGKVRDIVKDPKLAELLSPHTVVGCKRVCVDTGYLDTFNRPNVTLVDVCERPIERIAAEGPVVGNETYAVDSLVLATGFDAMTGALHKIDIRGRAGQTLVDKWAEGPRMYLGLGTSGFPNLFTITGPGSPSVLSNMLPSIEQHVNWISDCVAYMREKSVSVIEAQREAEDAWVDETNAIAEMTLFTTCNSWYLGANIPGKPRVFMPRLGYPPYVAKCNEVASKGYEGFTLS